MPDFKLQLQANRQHLSDKELVLADYLVKNQPYASTLSISALSAASTVSTATISRFAKNLGYPSFQSLRVALAQVEKPGLFAEISPKDPDLVIAQKNFAANSEALQATAAALSEKQLNLACELLLKARTVGFFGLGASNIVASDGYHKFLRTPLNLAYSPDYHTQLMTLARFDQRDVAILISHTGEDEDALTLAKVAKAHQVPLIVITSSAHARLAKSASVLLTVVAKETQYRAEALHALIAQMSLMDTLFVLVAVKTPDASTAVLEKIRSAIDETRK